MNGNLTAVKIANNYIINTTTNNYQLIVSEDISLNGRLFVGGNVSCNGNLSLANNGNVTLNSNITVSPNSTNATSNSWSNNNINWTSSASSQYNTTEYQSCNAFNNTNTTSWASTYNSTNSYTGGAYSGSSKQVTNNVNNAGLSAGVTLINGEWLQIQSSIPIRMDSYKLSSGGSTNQLPKTYYILGSNDNTNWYGIQNVSINTLPTTAARTLINTSIPVSTTTYTIPNYGGTGASYTLTSTGYIGASNTYSYFRMVITSIFSGGTNNPTEIGEWDIKMICNSSASLSMDNTNSNQLNVSSGATFTGRVGIGTTNPLAALHVVGPTNGGTALQCRYAPNPTGTSSTGIELSTLGAKYGIEIKGGIVQNTGGYGSITVLDSPTSTELMTFTKNGVGIGKTNPSVALDVAGDINVSGLTKAAGGVITKYYEVNVNTTLDAKYYGSFVSIVTATSGISLTLPPSQTGYIQIFNNTQVSHTIAGIGGSTFYGLTYNNAGSILIYPKDILTLFCGGNWVITDHTNFNSGLYENSSGNVGIGKTNPTVALDVVGDINSTGIINTNNAYKVSYSSGSTSFTAQFSHDRIAFNATNFYIVNSPNTTGVRLGNGDTSWSGQSDRRVKKNIIDLKYGLKDIKLLNPVNFDYNVDTSNNSHRLGFIAQEVLPIIPELVDYDTNQNIYYLGMTDLIPVTVKAIQEQQNIIETLQSENLLLKDQIQTILERLIAADIP